MANESSTGVVAPASLNVSAEGKSNGAEELSERKSIGSNPYKSVSYTGTVKVDGEVKDVSRTVHQMCNIDINYFDEGTGLTNLQRMQKGKPPIGSDGSPIQLHHIIQREPGTMIEIEKSKHERYHLQLHGLVEKGNSFRNDESLEKQYNNFRSRYWKWRAEQHLKG